MSDRVDPLLIAYVFCIVLLPTLAVAILAYLEAIGAIA